MTLLTPAWLVLLLPWAAACVWAGRTGDRRARVPFLALWPKTPGVAGRRWRRPPVWAALLMAGAGAAIVAAAGPAAVRPASTVTLLVDRTWAMPPKLRREAFGRLALAGGTRVRVWTPEADAAEDVDAADVPGVLDRIPMTAMPTRPAVDMTVRRLAASGPVAVLTDRSALGDPAGVIRIGPLLPVRNAGIDLLAVTDGPRPRAMVRLFNGTGVRQARLRVDGVERTVDLPASGKTADFFFDLPELGPTVEAELRSADGSAWADDVPGDDRAWLARTGRPGRVVPRTPLDGPLARMAAVYARHRPADADAPAIAIVRGEPADGPAVVLPDALGAGGGAGTVRVDASHPVARSVDWRGVDEAARATAGPTGEGWKAVVSDTAGPLLSVRERPARQVWVGFDTAVLADRADYVVLWTNVLDWLGGDVAWAAEPYRAGLTPLAAGVEGGPGLYRDRIDGRTVAVSAAAARPGAAGTGGTGNLAVVTRRTVPLSPGVLLAGLACVAAGLGIRRGLTRS